MKARRAVTDEQGLELLSHVLGAEAKKVSVGLFGPLVSFRLKPDLAFSMGMLEPGAVLVHSKRPGAGLALSHEVAERDRGLEEWFSHYLDWQAGERFGVIADETGSAIEGAPPRVAPPPPIELRGTAMRVQESLLGFLAPETDQGEDELIAAFDDPYFATETPLAPLEERWVLLVGVLDEQAPVGRRPPAKRAPKRATPVRGKR